MRKALNNYEFATDQLYALSRCERICRSISFARYTDDFQRELADFPLAAVAVAGVGKASQLAQTAIRAGRSGNDTENPLRGVMDSGGLCACLYLQPCD